MREIKFRGRDVKTGKVVYGSYLRGGKNLDGEIIPDWNPNISIAVEPESVAQLIGVDANGEEVYEEDKVRRLETGAVFRACFSDYDGILDGEIVKV